MKTFLVILIVAGAIGIGLYLKHRYAQRADDKDSVNSQVKTLGTFSRSGNWEHFPQSENSQIKEESAKVEPASEWQSILPGKWDLRLVETSNHGTMLVKGQIEIYPDGKFHMYITKKLYADRFLFRNEYGGYTEYGEKGLSGGDATGKWTISDSAFKFTDIQCHVSGSYSENFASLSSITSKDAIGCGFFETRFFGKVLDHNYVTNIARFDKDAIEIYGHDYRTEGDLEYIFNRTGKVDYAELPSVYIDSNKESKPVSRLNPDIQLKTIKKEPVEEDAPPFGVIDVNRAVVYSRDSYNNTFYESSEMISKDTKVDIAKAFKDYYFCEFSPYSDMRSSYKTTGWIRKKDVRITKSDAQLELERLFPPKKEQ